ncbi:hypothetical protein DFP72DRAFT_882338 [Ephemerocybe angulata]|uniref:Uncharacterized protein n=1 Tax=Ephemerocybe angulata TaxID=980116 RepID=A0A8H6IAD3_9AGAR|nr:hypothetical protein DFP72DRAFT_882338 [Tulosesus angulatus]
MQLDKALDIMEGHPDYHRPITEQPPDESILRSEPFNFARVPHESVVIDVLVFYRSVRGASYSSIYQLTRDTGSVAGQLNDLQLFRAAISAQKTVVRLLRNLVGSGGTSLYLPALANALKNLSIYLQNAGQKEDALLASKDSISAVRLVCDAYPHLNFRLLLAMNLRVHGDALVEAKNFSDASIAFKESVSLYAELVGEIQAGARASTFTILFSASTACGSYSWERYLSKDMLESHKNLKHALFYLSLTSKDDLDNYCLWRLPSRLFHLTARVLELLFTLGCSPALVGEIVDMYRLLSDTDPKRFSSQFLRCLYAYAYFCHFGTPDHHNSDILKLDPAHCIFQLVCEEGIVHRNDDNSMAHGSFEPAIHALLGSENGVQIIHKAIWAYLSPTSNMPMPHAASLAGNTHHLIVSFATLYPDVALGAVDFLSSSPQVQQGAHNGLLLRALSLLRDTSEKLDPAFHSQVTHCAQMCMKLSRSCLLDIELPGALVAFGVTLLHCREQDSGMAAVDEATSLHRSQEDWDRLYAVLGDSTSGTISPDEVFSAYQLQSPESSEQRKMLYTVLDLSAGFQRAGQTVAAFKCYRELLQLCVKFEELNTFQDVTPEPLVITLLRICAHLLAYQPPRSYPLAQYAHHLFSTTTTTLPYAHISLYAVLIQCLRVAALTDNVVLDPYLASKIFTAFEGGVAGTFEIQEKFQAYEHLIHFHALQGQSSSVDGIVQRAYSLHKDALGGEIGSLADWGLRHDTLAIIASHYAKLERPENVIAFATAAVEASKECVPNLAEDTQYLESMCDVAAYLWNSNHLDDAVALMELVAGARQASTSELGLSIRTSYRPGSASTTGDAKKAPVDAKAAREACGHLRPEHFLGALRAYMADPLPPPLSSASCVNEGDGQPDILSYLASIEALVEEHMEVTGYKTKDTVVEETDTSCGVEVTLEDDLGACVVELDSEKMSDGEKQLDCEVILTRPLDSKESSTRKLLEGGSDKLSRSSPTSSFISETPTHVLRAKLLDDHVLASSAIRGPPRAETQTAFLSSIKQWAAFVANLLIISWSVVYAVFFISPSLGRGSFRLPS